MTLYTDRPQPGFYKTKLVKGGPWVPVRIWWEYPVDPHTGETLDRSPTLRCEKNGEAADPWATWMWCADKPITEEEYQIMRGFPTDNPRAPINLDKMPPVF